MKKLLVILVLVQFAVLRSFAQHDPRITFGSIPNNYESVNGKEPATKTTRSQIIANDKLVLNVPGYEVTSYTFMIKVGTDIIYGPVSIKGGQLTPGIINAIKNAKGPDIYAYFDDLKVKEPAALIRTCASMAFTFDQ